MPAIIRTWSVALVVLGIGLAGLWAACNVTIQMPPEGEDDTQVGGSIPDNPDDGTPPADDPTPPDDDPGNPNSPCPDPTNIYVTYKNEWSARVSFIEGFRDESYAVLAGAIYVLEPAGTAGDTQNKCITCPNQAGIRSVQYLRDGAWTFEPYPSDLFRGAFKCGDHITFVFKNDGSVTTQVETP
jgi:hypothetical protein